MYAAKEMRLILLFHWLLEGSERDGCRINPCYGVRCSVQFAVFGGERANQEAKLKGARAYVSSVVEGHVEAGA